MTYVLIAFCGGVALGGGVIAVRCALTSFMERFEQSLE